MHVEQLLGRSPILYSGASADKPQAVDQSGMAPFSGGEPDLLWSGTSSGMGASALKVEMLPPPPPLRLAPASHESPEAGPVLKLLAVNPPLDLSTVLPGATTGGATSHGVGADGRQSAAPPVKVSATYTISDSQFIDLHIAQANVLVDADVMRADPSVLAAAGLGSADLQHALAGTPELAQLVQEAIDALPSDTAPASLANGVDRATVMREDPLRVEAPSESDVIAQHIEPGHYIDGARAGNSGSSTDVINEQVAKVGEAVEAATPVEHGVVETKVSPDGGLHIVTDLAPTGGVAQEAITGGNDLVNAAVLYDLSEAASSTIVHGDVRRTDAIVQVNVLKDNDAISFSSTAFLEAAVASNEVANEATFVEEAGPVYGNVLLGGAPGALTWEIDYVQGNFYDLTTVEQYSVFIDTDISEQTTTSAHFTATLGENGAVNLTQLSQLASQYDLIIVGGTFYEFNSIVQVNVLLDDDVIHQLANGSADQSADAEGNALVNDAAIVRIGGDGYKPLAGDPASLAEAIGSREAEFDQALARGLPGNGTDTIRVLYVTGDYYDYNVLLQTNVLSDGDRAEQVGVTDRPAVADGQDSAGAIAQTADAGGNSLQNVALIVSVGSTSDYQYVGGTVYEDTLLLQANIVTDTDEAAEASLHPDVVATIAALSGSAEDTAPGSDSPPGHADSSASVDVIGGILA
jgi:hypothetical protein